MSLQRFQLDLAARLEASAFFANIPILVFRPRAAPYSGTVDIILGLIRSAKPTHIDLYLARGGTPTGPQ